MAELEKLTVDEELIRDVGIANFTHISPAVLEIEIHPYFEQKRFIKWVRKQNIQVIAYAFFGNVAFEAVPPHLTRIEKLLSHPTIKKFAEEYNINAGQVALGRAVQNEYVVISKSVNEDHMRSNLAAYDVSFDEENWKEVDALDQKDRLNDFYIENYTFDYPLF